MPIFFFKKYPNLELQSH